MTRPFSAVLIACVALPGLLPAQWLTRDRVTAEESAGSAAVSVAPSAPANAHADATTYADADAYADAAPAAAERSVTTLAAYLARVGPDDRTRARALYRWVTRHIAYDANAFRTGNYGDVSPAAVLARRATICEGYARLTQALGTNMGLQVEVVTGWSKGYGYAPGQRIAGPTNHAWNVVQVDGVWRLMDPTWGAGYLDEQLRFVRAFQDHYFLTVPEDFVFDHLPLEPRWQLVARPTSAAEYSELAYLRPMFFTAGLHIESHPHARIAASDRVTVTLGVTRPVELSAQLVDAATNRPLDGEFALAQVGDDKAEVRAAFPRAGDYVLRLFARPRGSQQRLEWALDYRVHASRGAVDAALPIVYAGFGTSGATLVAPLGGVLEPGRSYQFRLRAPGAVDVAVVSGTHWTHLTRHGDEYSGTVRAAAGENVVFAKFPGAADFTGFLKYVGR